MGLRLDSTFYPIPTPSLPLKGREEIRRSALPRFFCRMARYSRLSRVGMLQGQKTIDVLTGKPDVTRGGGDLAGLRVLIADRHFTVRTWMREQMSVIGATSISMAANASELMRMARTLPYDIVICDHHLDEKRDGQQLLEELRF